MVEFRDFFNRDIDQINDVAERVEDIALQDSDSLNGPGWAADDYLAVIDLSTKPGILSEHEVYRLNRSIGRLNERYLYMSRRMALSSIMGPFIIDAYDNVAEQINHVNGSDPSRWQVQQMVYIHKQNNA